MPGISNDTVQEFQNRLYAFNPIFVADWENWCTIYQDGNDEIPYQFGKIMRKWQSCRPNRMRRTRIEHEHAPPYLEDLIEESSGHINILMNVDLPQPDTITNEVEDALIQLWNILENLSYMGRARNGLAGVVGISKAVMLLSKGCVGPAFDSNVQYNLGLYHIYTANSWIEAIKRVSDDIHNFELANGCTLQEATPEIFQAINIGRIYDMALGPR